MAIDHDAIVAAVRAGLPDHARWTVGGTPLDWDFTGGRRGVRRLSAGDVVGGGGAEAAWADLLIVGQYRVADGGGASPWVAVCEGDGAVCGLDVERGEDAVFLFNSSIRRFVQTFHLLHDRLRVGARLPRDVESLARRTEPDIASEWRLFIEHAGDS